MFDMALPFNIAPIGVAYLLGTVQTGLLVAGVNGVPLRERGSGNTGAANVVRVIGWRGGVVTLLGDAGKGFGAALLGARYIDASAGPAIAGLAAVAGHCFPLWWRFRGGKGVATTIGVALFVFPWVGLIAVAVYGAVLLATRTSSAGSMGAMAVITIGSVVAGTPAVALGLEVAVAIVVIRHRENLRRLAEGRELVIK